MVVGAPDAMMWRIRRVGTAAASTTPGAVRVLAWLLGVMVIGVGGNAIASDLGAWWYVIGLALMTFVAGWWIRRRVRRSSRMEGGQTEI